MECLYADRLADSERAIFSSLDDEAPDRAISHEVRGGVWAARFQGKNDIFLQGVDKGAAYINILLAHPGRETSVDQSEPFCLELHQ